MRQAPTFDRRFCDKPAAHGGRRFWKTMAAVFRSIRQRRRCWIGIVELPVSDERLESLAGATRPPSITGRSLWDSYKVAIGLISKTYARDGTSAQ
jgi:hypothetical protein